MTVSGRPKGRFLWLRAETFIHVGVGQQSSLIDLPFAREGATGFPYIPGSGMKGALRDMARLALRWNGGPDPADEYFGKQEEAGPVVVSDARLAFLPVRSLSAAYRYVTSIDLMHRLKRDLEFAGEAPRSLTLSLPDDKAEYLGPDSGQPSLFLEEFAFSRHDDAGIDELIRLLPVETRTLVKSRVAILSATIFDYFARHGLHVRSRNKLVPETKTVDGGALWTEESLPPDTLMYVVLAPRLHGQEARLADLVSKVFTPCDGFFQVGGNETVGEGWFRMLDFEATATSQQGAAGQGHPPPADAVNAEVS